ncbi:uncharacterized protein BDV17DRAFT_252593 [Aspergillus undulatus]|uniref:uncharacterized protein n=1 Tax=Aspergillus undulatus TaxID=1810928 RepID=UPI003CCCB2CB
MRFTSPLYLLPLAALTAAKQVGYFNSDDCADPSGFESCYDDADSWWADCVNETCEGQNIDCINTCEYARQGTYTRCAAAHCWNMVYSCEYQLQASDSVNSGINPDLERAPYFPAPDNAAGRCSCNIGHLTEAQVIVNEVIAQCGDLVDPFSQTSDEIESIGNGCLCCGMSGLLSALAATCPKLDPAKLEMDDFEQLLTDNMAGIDWTTCQEWLNQYDCAADFGYPSAIETYYGPGNIPEGGPETLYNIGALTTPVSATVTFTVGSELFPVTAVSTDADVPTGSATGSSSSSGNGNEESGNGSSNSDSDGGNESGDNAQSDSDDQATGSGDIPEDVAAHQVAMSSTLFMFVAATLGVAYIL